MKATSVGLLCLGTAVLILLLLVLLGLADHPGLITVPHRPAIEFYGGLTMHVLATLGFVLCLLSPRDLGHRGWLIAAAVLVVTAILGEIAKERILRWLLEVASLRIAALAAVYFTVVLHAVELIALGSFLGWLRSVALYLHSPKQAKAALDLIKTGAVILLILLLGIAFIFLHEPPKDLPGNQVDTVGFVLACVIPGARIALLIWLGGLASLLFGVRGRLAVPPQQNVKVPPTLGPTT
jgi:hypothetical protein